ncbi:hypothetical protein [Bradyrhizobium sp. B120]|uniref:hypothetical protein n=1 Tax=Bradyrhizobium sp. B120 TaxID=3410088 RepID=UPI003B987B9B
MGLDPSKRNKRPAIGKIIDDGLLIVIDDVLNLTCVTFAGNIRAWAGLTKKGADFRPGVIELSLDGGSWAESG